MSAYIEAFRQAASNTGLELPGEIIADGKRHRFTVTGDRARSNNGWYVLHSDDPAAGAFGCWKRQINETWCGGKSYPGMSDEEKTAYRARMEAIKRDREAERERIQAECRAWCASTWGTAKEANHHHPYLKAKGVSAYGLKAYKDSLIVPVRDMAGAIHGLQFIQPDGGKKFKTGTAKEGRFHKIGTAKDNTLFICEGYATGASIHDATGHAVAIGFDAGNLLSVAQGIRSKYSDMRIVLAADNDQWTPGNPGLTKATEAARAVGGLLVVPVFEGVNLG